MALRPDKTAVVFPSQGKNTSSSPTVITLTCDASTDSIHGVTLAGPDASHFTIVHNLTAKAAGQYSFEGGALAKGFTTLQVLYTPTAASSGHNAVLRIHHNGVGRAYTTEIPLSGVAV